MTVLCTSLHLYNSLSMVVCLSLQHSQNVQFYNVLILVLLKISFPCFLLKGSICFVVFLFTSRHRYFLQTYSNLFHWWPHISAVMFRSCNVVYLILSTWVFYPKRERFVCRIKMFLIGIELVIGVISMVTALQHVSGVRVKLPNSKPEDIRWNWTPPFETPCIARSFMC